jgi:propanol-preferring alcohol dehydrogenase
MKVTAGKGVDVVLDCVGSENTIRDSLRILCKRGALVIVGLFGSELKIPLLSSLLSEHQVYLSLWGNYSELTEVIELAKQGKIKHIVQEFPLNEINEAIAKLKEGQVKGRAVIVPR